MRTVALQERFAPAAVRAFYGLADALLVDNCSSVGTWKQHGWTQFLPWLKGTNDHPATRPRCAD